MMRQKSLMAAALALSISACQPPTSDSPPTEPSDDNYQQLLAGQFGDYQQANANRLLRFPEDHGAHPDFRMEWWYVTANLEDQLGNWYGVQWTLFRSGLDGPKSLGDQRQVYMAHAALSWPGGHHAMQKYARAGTGQAGVQNPPFHAWLDHWQLRSTNKQSWLPLAMTAADDQFSFDLVLDSDKPLVLQGQQGFSVKNTQGSGSYYYSHPYLEVSGKLNIDGQSIAVSGSAWLDREWSSQFLLPSQQGWDWLALHLDDGDKVMIYQLRGQQLNSADTVKWLSWFDSAGNRKVLTRDFELSALEYATVAQRQIPQRWLIRYGKELTLEATAKQANQWMDLDYPYWEGPVDISGSHAGVGYLEMTGYPLGSTD
ncbi:iron ABC transporter permease [Neiella sp. HB171785]|uniref:Iron ABC transporter permease n=1 Tax=Neiella litorisoli TaxID=2771431 RepID=A0A8J6QLL8_9GAMM|nr:lipocalin-like domain-containing protein [Neiella litorisoli]MBD1390477.1 iron ABC transporter permease [Neiella litorisoli]